MAVLRCAIFNEHLLGLQVVVNGDQKFGLSVRRNFALVCKHKRAAIGLCKTNLLPINYQECFNVS